jgi:hypothetical protein
VGWRIDYFLISKSLETKLIDAKTRDDILGSDHCPVEIPEGQQIQAIIHQHWLSVMDSFILWLSF